MVDLYLILHKVRGEPAFDIAQRLCSNPPCQPNCGCWNGDSCSMANEWIIPTSGHTAHPYRVWDMGDLRDISDIGQFGNHIGPMQCINALPADWPDHYPAPSATEPKSTIAERANSILSAIGIGRKAGTFKLLGGKPK